MLKKIITSLVIIIILLICAFVGYKIFLLAYYNVDNETRNVAINSARNFNNYTETLMIESHKISEDEYYKCENYKIKNKFNDFKMIEGCETQYLAEGEHAHPTFEIKNNDGTAKEYIDLTIIENNKVVALKNFDDTLDEDKQDSKTLKKMIKDNKIKSDTDFLSYMHNNINNKTTIFSSGYEIKEFYHINYQASLYRGLKSITLIDGDQKGYILNYDGSYKANILNPDGSYKDVYRKIKHVYINDKDKTLMIILIGDEITTDEYIKDLVSTLVFE